MCEPCAREAWKGARKLEPEAPEDTFYPGCRKFGNESWQRFLAEAKTKHKGANAREGNTYSQRNRHVAMDMDI